VLTRDIAFPRRDPIGFGILGFGGGVVE
jgi:hypothetical protein